MGTTIPVNMGWNVGWETHTIKGVRFLCLLKPEGECRIYGGYRSWESFVAMYKHDGPKLILPRVIARLA